MKKKPVGKSEIRIRHRLFFSPEYKALSSSAKILYIHLRVCHSWLCHSDPNLPISQSDKELREDTGLSERAVTHAKKLLIEGCWIQVENGTMGTLTKPALASKYWILKFDASHFKGMPSVPLSGDVRRQRERPTFGGYNVVNNLSADKQNTPAEDICKMLTEDPDPTDDEGYWPF